MTDRRVFCFLCGIKQSVVHGSTSPTLQFVGSWEVEVNVLSSSSVAVLRCRAACSRVLLAWGVPSPWEPLEETANVGPLQGQDLLMG